jgi:2-dehydro-3-deoxyphosphogluconate aldolase/(4S)-4-hydroxy-2-oxoglutarate aldolase
MDNSAIQRMLDAGVVAIMRAKSSDQLLEAAEAVREGGVTAIEVTMTTPGALRVIEQAVARYG